ncbi:MAG: DNA circularization N-terminal domain-containing protein [Pseudomonadota bacterium]
MAWRAELRTASFRDVPFHVEGATLAAGRRLARHEYPQRDVPYLEDMGRRAREYKVEAYIVGPDYMAGRDQLLAAIEEAGPGQLVHPYHGTVRVTVSDCQLTESTQHGGLAKFSITFVEAGEQREPATETDTEGVLDAQYLACEAAFAGDFGRVFSIDGLPEFAAQDALDSVNALLELPEMALGELGWIRANPLSALTALLPENLQASLGNPLALANGILALVRNAAGVMSLFAFSRPAVGSAIVTPTRQAQNRNRAAFTSLVRQAAAARRIVDLAKSEPATLDDARLARAEIVTRADAVLLDEATGQQAAEAILQLRTDAVAHFARIQPQLPRLVSVTPQAVRPALVLAHDFYGDDWLAAGREDELLARNRVRHPGFVPAGRALELVS